MKVSVVKAGYMKHEYVPNFQVKIIRKWISNRDCQDKGPAKANTTKITSNVSFCTAK